MRLSELVGRELIKHETVTEGILGRQTMQTRWTVIEAYSNHVVAVRQTETGYLARESFNIGTLVTMGVIEQPRTRQHYEHTRNGWGC